jgi:hypothetical protein
VNAPSPASGQALTYNGSEWVPQDTGTGSRAAVMLSGTQSIPDNVLTQVSGTLMAFNVGGWAISGGALVVPSGVTRIDVLSQASWASVGAAELHAHLALNGVALSGLAGYTLDPGIHVQKTSSPNTFASQVKAMDIPVSGGDLLSLRVLQDSVGALDLLGSGNEHATFLQAREAGGGGGGGGGAVGAGNDDRCSLTSASGHLLVHETSTDVIFDNLSYLYGSISAPTLSGTDITIGKDGLYTIHAQGAFPSNAVGRRYISVYVDGEAAIPLDGIITGLPFMQVTATAGGIGTRVSTSCEVELLVGAVVTLRALQGSGDPLAFRGSLQLRRVAPLA